MRKIGIAVLPVQMTDAAMVTDQSASKCSKYTLVRVRVQVQAPESQIQVEVQVSDLQVQVVLEYKYQVLHLWVQEDGPSEI